MSIRFSFYIFFNMDDYQQLTDIDEAKIIISLKNDEINNIKASITTLNKKNNIKMAELQYKVDQEKSKSSEAEKKSAKLQQKNKKQKAQMNDQIKRLNEEIHKIKQKHNEAMAEERKKERQVRGIAYEQKLKYQKEKEINNRIHTQIQFIKKYFDPKKILNFVGTNKIDDIPGYIDLYKRNTQKDQEIKYLIMQIDRLKHETILGMQESLVKISTYEQYMQNLKEQNKQLEQNIGKKQEQLYINTIQIINKEQIIEQAKLQQHIQLQTLNQQLQNLKKEVNSYEEAEVWVQKDIQYTNYVELIQRLQKQLQQKQNYIDQLLNESEYKITYLKQENEMLKKQYDSLCINLSDDKSILHGTIHRLQQSILEKEEIISMLHYSIKEQENYFQEQKKELQRYINEVNELLKKKRRKEEQMKDNQLSNQQQIRSLQEQLTFFRNQNYQQQIQKSSRARYLSGQFNINVFQSKKPIELNSVVSKEEHKTLFMDIKADSDGLEPSQFENKVHDLGQYEIQHNHFNWSQMYYDLLKRHNGFIKKVRNQLKILTTKP